MSERKWIELTVDPEGELRIRAPGVDFSVPAPCLRDAPPCEECERWRLSTLNGQRLASETKSRERAEQQRDALRDRVAELERELDEVCQERDGAQSDLSTLETRWEEAKRERDEARREAEELRQERYRLRHELEEAENVARCQPVYPGDINSKSVVKSLVSRGIVRKNRDGDYVLRTPNPECSAPHRTHCVPVRVTSQLTNTPGPWEKLVEIQLPYSAGQTKATIPADMLLSPSHGYDAKEVEDWRRDAAEAANIRAENERLRDAGCVLDEAMDSGPRERESARRTWRSTCQPARCPLTCPHGDQCTLEREHDGGHNHRGCDCNEPDQPAPQTHYREGDLVLESIGPRRECQLTAFVGFREDKEVWETPHSPSGTMYFQAGRDPILERDGVPTDEGLRRLAEKAGYAFQRLPSEAGLEGMQIDDGIPHSRGKLVCLYGDDPKWRKRLAAALREMGGA